MFTLFGRLFGRALRRAVMRNGIAADLRALLVGGAGLVATANAAVVVETVYFDIDFSSPLHRVGSPPATNAGTAAPSAISFGRPEVVASFGPLTDQPVVLNTAGNTGSYGYDQFRLSLGHQEPTYHVSFDLYTVGLVGSTSQFMVFVDIPSSAALGFYPSGIMYPPCWPAPSPLPRFVDGTLMHIDISMDIRNNRSVTVVNGVVIGDGAAIGGTGSPRDLNSVRFSLTGDPSTSVAIDNIRVTNGFFVPESGVPTLLMISAGISLLFRHRGR